MTGAAGFVGQHVVSQLRERGAIVVEVRHRWTSGVELRSLIGAAEVATCIHLGWYTDPADYLTNIEGNRDSVHATQLLAEELGRMGASHVVAVGSSAEYGPNQLPHDENEPESPLSVYGEAKVRAHAVLRERLDPSIVLAWARPFNVTGPGEHGGRLIPTVVGTLLNQRPIDLSDGAQVRDFLDVADVASGLIAISDAQRSGVFNVSSGEGVSLRTLLSEVADKLGGQDLLRFGRVARSVRDADVVVGRNDRLCSIGWARRFDQESMIQRVIRHWTTVEGVAE